MSMLSAQCDELRAMAQLEKSLERPAIARILGRATDTIIELRGALQVASADYRHLQAENAKLRELVRYMWDFSCVLPDEPYTSKEELAYSVEVWKRMRELGIEVDDGVS